MHLKLTEAESEIEKAMRQAGSALLSYWRIDEKSGSTLGVEKKPDGSFVTKADFASNEILVSALTKQFPSDGILSEEIPMDSHLQSLKRVWIIDPLDGTQSFIHGNDDFSILVALTVDSHSELGYMYFPAREKFAIARKGGGAWQNAEKMQVSSHAALRAKSVYYRNFQPTNPALCYDKNMDSGCAFLMVASGVFDGLIIKIVSHREWDLAAPAVVVEESGGKVTNEFGEAVRFEPGKMNCRYFVASNGVAHEQLLAMIPPEDRVR